MKRKYYGINIAEVLFVKTEEINKIKQKQLFQQFILCREEKVTVVKALVWA